MTMTMIPKLSVAVVFAICMTHVLVVSGQAPGSIGLCDVTKDCDDDRQCANGMICADDHKEELKKLNYDERGANCPNLDKKQWNYELCFDPIILNPSGGGGGDPHFRTYDGTRYSFHGQCDLVMARSTEFADGQGIDIHARTQIVDDWSLISNVAIRIGDDIVEIVNDATYYVNGMTNIDLPFTIDGKFTISRSIENLESIAEDEEKVQDTMDVFTIELGTGNYNKNEQIKIQNYKNMLSVRVDAALYGTAGMLGVHGKVGMIGRDMTTQIEDPNAMGSEWQVMDTEPMLFQDTTHSPQYPERCIMPTALMSRRRLRTSESDILKAKEACVNVNIESFDFCVQDVLQTGDVTVAKTYNYGFAF